MRLPSGGVCGGRWQTLGSFTSFLLNLYHSKNESGSNGWMLSEFKRSLAQFTRPSLEIGTNKHTKNVPAKDAPPTETLKRGWDPVRWKVKRGTTCYFFDRFIQISQHFMHLLYLQDLNGKPLQILISEDQFKLLRVLSYADMSSTVFSATTNWSHKAEGAIGSLDWDFPNPVDHWFKQRLCGMRSSKIPQTFFGMSEQQAKEMVRKIECKFWFPFISFKLLPKYVLQPPIDFIVALGSSDNSFYMLKFRCSRTICQAVGILPMEKPRREDGWEVMDT